MSLSLARQERDAAELANRRRRRRQQLPAQLRRRIVELLSEIEDVRLAARSKGSVARTIPIPRRIGDAVVVVERIVYGRSWEVRARPTVARTAERRLDAASDQLACRLRGYWWSDEPAAVPGNPYCPIHGLLDWDDVVSLEGDDEQYTCAHCDRPVEVR